jgi:hypothetical protein
MSAQGKIKAKETPHLCTKIYCKQEHHCSIQINDIFFVVLENLTPSMITYKITNVEARKNQPANKFGIN